MAEGRSHTRLLAPTAGVLAIGAFCGLVVWGLAWGVPGGKRSELEGTTEAAKNLDAELLRRSWQTWGSRGRRSPIAESFPRHLFNPLRSYHPDEYQVFKSLATMSPGRLDFDPKNYIYPSLHAYLVGAALGVCHLAGLVHLERNLAYYFDHPDQMGRMYLVGRALSLLAAVGALALTWLAGRRLGRGAGVLAVVVLAAMPALCVHSHNLTRDTFTALATTLFFLSCLKLAREGTPLAYDLAGAAAGLCVAFQYFAAVLWVMIPLAGLLHRLSGTTTEEARAGGGWRTVAVGSGVALIVMAAVFALACPYHLLHADQFIADFRSETPHVTRGLVSKALSLGWAVHLPRMLPALVGWPLTVAVGVGVAWALVRRSAGSWLLLAWLVLWAGVVGLDGRAYSRYYVGLLPCLALLSANGLVGLGGVARRLGHWPHLAISAIALLALLAPTWVISWAWARLYSLENVRTIAGEWIRERVPAGARVGMTRWPWQFEMPPIDPRRYRLVILARTPEENPWDVVRLQRLRPDYFVTSSIEFGRIPASGAGDERGRFWHYLLASGQMYRVVAKFKVPHPLFGADLAAFPEDMRYVNPTILVLELRDRRA